MAACEGGCSCTSCPEPGKSQQTGSSECIFPRAVSRSLAHGNSQSHPVHINGHPEERQNKGWVHRRSSRPRLCSTLWACLDKSSSSRDKDQQSWSPVTCAAPDPAHIPSLLLTEALLFSPPHTRFPLSPHCLLLMVSNGPSFFLLPVSSISLWWTSFLVGSSRPRLLLWKGSVP